MASTLYDLTTDSLRLMEALEQCEGGEVPPETEAFLDENATDIAQKLDAYLAVIHTLDMEAVRAKAERDQWEAKRKAREKSIEHLKANLKLFLERTGQTKATTASGRVIALQAAGGQQAMQVDECLDLDAVFPAWVQTVRCLNREEVRKYLEEGHELVYARLLPRSQTIRIR